MVLTATMPRTTATRPSDVVVRRRCACMERGQDCSKGENGLQRRTRTWAAVWYGGWSWDFTLLIGVAIGMVLALLVVSVGLLSPVGLVAACSDSARPAGGGLARVTPEGEGLVDESPVYPSRKP